MASYATVSTWPPTSATTKPSAPRSRPTRCAPTSTAANPARSSCAPPTSSTSSSDRHPGSSRRTMRKSPVALLLAALAVGAVACGGGNEAEPSAGQSGRPNTPETTEATTTTTELTVDTLPEDVVDIPDISDLDLEWNETAVVDQVTGDVAMADFNRYLFERAPSAMVPEDTFADLEGDDLDAAVAAAELEAPLKTATLFLGLEPDDPDAQMLRASSGG